MGQDPDLPRTISNELEVDPLNLKATAPYLTLSIRATLNEGEY